MNIKENLQSATNRLSNADRQVEAGEYHVAIQSIAAAYANVRAALELTYKLECQFKQPASPAGEDNV